VIFMWAEDNVYQNPMPLPAQFVLLKEIQKEN
jgi:hypothetical protein